MRLLHENWKYFLMKHCNQVCHWIFRSNGPLCEHFRSQIRRVRISLERNSRLARRVIHGVYCVTHFFLRYLADRGSVGSVGAEVPDGKEMRMVSVIGAERQPPRLWAGEVRRAQNGKCSTETPTTAQMALPLSLLPTRVSSSSNVNYLFAIESLMFFLIIHLIA